MFIFVFDFPSCQKIFTGKHKELELMLPNLGSCICVSAFIRFLAVNYSLISSGLYIVMWKQYNLENTETCAKSNKLLILHYSIK